MIPPASLRGAGGPQRRHTPVRLGVASHVMMDDRQLRSWVSDQLHALLGFAEGSLAAYVVALGESPACLRALATHTAFATSGGGEHGSKLRAKNERREICETGLAFAVVALGVSTHPEDASSVFSPSFAPGA